MIVTSKVTDHRALPGSPEIKTLASTAGNSAGELGSHISHHAMQPKSEKKKLKHNKTRCT